MAKNVCFLVRKNNVYVSLHSISECVGLPVNTLRGLFFKADVDSTEYYRANGTLYLTEDAACDLLTAIAKYADHDNAKVESFHIWMHETFAGISVTESKPDDLPEDDADDTSDADSDDTSADECDDESDDSPADKSEEDGDVCPIYDALREIVNILKLQKRRIDRLEDKLEDELCEKPGEKA